MKSIDIYKKLFVVLVVYFLVIITGCCSQRYNYYFYKKRGEDALLSKNYKKARNYFSIIYKNESSGDKVDREKTTWAYYRLGVIAELMGDLKMAKGYYWGDAIDETFYEGQRLTNWYAQEGWKQVDEKECARTLDDILEFEKTEPPEVNEEEKTERKKEIIIPKKQVYKPFRHQDNSGEVTRTFIRSVTLPPRDVPEPFKILY